MTTALLTLSAAVALPGTASAQAPTVTAPSSPVPVNYTNTFGTTNFSYPGLAGVTITGGPITNLMLSTTGTAGTFSTAVLSAAGSGSAVTVTTAGTINGASYSQPSTASGGTAPFTYTVASGAIPTGTALNPATGTVAGNPTAAGTFTYTIKVSDGAGQTATTATVTVTIGAALSLSAGRRPQRRSGQATVSPTR